MLKQVQIPKSESKQIADEMLTNPSSFVKKIYDELKDKQPELYEALVKEVESYHKLAGPVTAILMETYALVWIARMLPYIKLEMDLTINEEN